MKPCNSYNAVSLGEISPGDERFKISARDGISPSLVRSIQCRGLIQPPLVIHASKLENASGQEGYLIVSGFQRLAALAAMETPPEEVVCGIMEDEKDAAAAAVMENAFEHALSPMELLRAVTLLSRFMSVQEMADDSPALFNTQYSAKFIKSQLKLAGELSHDALELLGDGRLAVKPAARLLQCPAEIQAPIVEILSQIKASASKQMEIITAYREITARDGLTPNALLESEDFQAVLNTPTQDLARRTNLVRQYLVQCRYPALEAARQKAGAALNKLKLPQIQWQLPDNFEGTDYRVTLTFKSRDEFNKRLEDLASVKDHQALEGLLER